MKKIIILAFLLLLPSPALAERGLLKWKLADKIELNLWTPGTGGETPFGGTQPATGDCKVSIDGAAEANTARPVLVDGRWTIDLTAAQTMGRHITIHCKDQGGGTDFVEQFVFFDVTDTPNGKLQTCSAPDCPDNLQYVKLAATETAGDNAFRRETFTTVDGAGAWQSMKICDWELATSVARLCEPLEIAVDNTTYYRITAADTEFTFNERAQLRSSLGIDGDKVAAVGGQLQTLDTAVQDVKDTTDQFVFTIDNKVDARVDYIGPDMLTGLADVKDFSTGQVTEINSALGLTGTKVAGTGGVIQAINAKTTQLSFSGGGVVSAPVSTVTLADGSITRAKFANNAIDSGVIATDSITSDEIAVSGAAEMASGVFSATSGAELSGLPNATPPWGDMLKFLYESGIHKLTTVKTGTGTAKQRVYKRNGTAILGESNVTDNGTTFTRDRYQ